MNSDFPKKIWYVIETPCYPCAFKVTFSGLYPDEGSNSPWHFFRTREEAEQEADRRNRDPIYSN